MSHQMPPLPWLRAFEASARHLSFTNAATELNLTQAAISKQVKLLEQYLREPLFERLPRSLTLTKAGSAYLPKVNDAFERLSAGTIEVFGGRRLGILSVRAPVGYAITWLAARLPRFLATHPKTQVRIVSSVWADDYDSETFDLDIRYGFGSWAGFTADRVTWERLIPICLPEVAKRMTAPNDLSKERLLHVLGYQEGWATWLAAAGALQVDPGSGLWFDTTPMALEVAAQGGDMFDHHHVARFGFQVPDVSAVDLHEIDGELLQIAEPRRPRAEIIQAHPDPALAQPRRRPSEEVAVSSLRYLAGIL